MELKSKFDWKPLPEPIEKHEADQKRIADTLKQVEAYWNETAPYGAPQFDAGRGMALLLFDANRYRDGLNRVITKAQEHEALIKHREETGQEVTDADRQRWFAYLDMAHVAEEVLSPNPPSVNSDTGQH
jgi:hypothetical protein